VKGGKEGETGDGGGGANVGGKEANASGNCSRSGGETC